MDACEALLASHVLPPEIELQTRRNMVFYARPLNDLLAGVETWPVHLSRSREQRYHSPSVANGGNDLLMLVWGASSAASLDSQNSAGNVTAAPDPSFSLLSFTADLDIRDARAVRDFGQPAGLPALRSAGVDAARLFHHAGSWWICTSGDGAGTENAGYVTLLRLDGDAIHHRKHLSIGSSQHVFPVGSGGERGKTSLASLPRCRLCGFWNTSARTA